jgi:hypothetical protein
MKTRLVLLLCVLGVSGRAQSPGTFTATGEMITPRFLDTTTLLPDGKVLIAGGDSSCSPATNAEASAELYDPIIGAFVATGSMTTPREGHTATLLPNGKVLIAGGGPVSVPSPTRLPPPNFTIRPPARSPPRET